MKIAIGLLSGWLFISYSHAAVIEKFQLNLTQETVRSDCSSVTELTLVTGGLTEDKAFLEEKVLGICDLYINPDPRVYTLKNHANKQKWQSKSISAGQGSLIIEVTTTGIKTTEVLLGNTIIKYASKKPEIRAQSLSVGNFKLQAVAANSCRYPASITIDTAQERQVFAFFKPSQQCADTAERFYLLKQKKVEKKAVYEGFWVENNGARQLKVFVSEDGQIQSVDEIKLPEQNTQQWHISSGR